MNGAQEKLAVRAIRRKIEVEGYGALTRQEKNVFAYSPYGTGGGHGGGCLAAAQNRSAIPYAHLDPPSMN